MPLGIFPPQLSDLGPNSSTLEGICAMRDTGPRLILVLRDLARASVKSFLKSNSPPSCWGSRSSLRVPQEDRHSFLKMDWTTALSPFLFLTLHRCLQTVPTDYTI